jgi:hypothetical protein
VVNVVADKGGLNKRHAFTCVALLLAHTFVSALIVRFMMARQNRGQSTHTNDTVIHVQISPSAVPGLSSPNKEI